MGKPTRPDWPGSIPRDRFNNLLWTWHVNIHRRRIPIELKDWIGSDRQLNEQALEEQYGIGKWSDRKGILDIALNALEKKTTPVGFDKTWRTLNDAKAALVQWYVDNNTLDNYRVVDTERHIILSQLYNWALRAQRFFHLEYGSNSVQTIARTMRPRTSQERIWVTQREVPQTVWAPSLNLTDRGKPKTVQLLDDLIVHLSNDPFLQHFREQPVRNRRSHVGAPSPKRSIVTPATQALAKAGVTGWMRADMLTATGLSALALNRK